MNGIGFGLRTFFIANLSLYYLSTQSDLWPKGSDWLFNCPVTFCNSVMFGWDLVSSKSHLITNFSFGTSTKGLGPHKDLGWRMQTLGEVREPSDEDEVKRLQVRKYNMVTSQTLGSYVRTNAYYQILLFQYCILLINEILFFTSASLIFFSYFFWSVISEYLYLQCFSSLFFFFSK